MSVTFDPAKPVRTRDGRKARIICTDAKADMSVVALVTGGDGKEFIDRYRADGGWSIRADLGHSNRDLINIPERRECWVVFWGKGRSTSCPNEADALTHAKVLNDTGYSDVSGPHHFVTGGDA